MGLISKVVKKWFAIEKYKIIGEYNGCFKKIC